MNRLFRELGYLSTHDFSWRFPKYSRLLKKPHDNDLSNRAKEDADEVSAIVTEAMKIAGIAKNEQSNDLICPSISDPNQIAGLASYTTLLNSPSRPRIYEV